mmetsp:Transcript_33563/g.67783  ORF Transcript_33563/g.67783 Transcript_33563/m.67783 type:complete len:263 (+) Transcript_33563:949-1737(+)
MDRKHFELTEECGVKFGTLATGKYYYNFPVGIAAQSGKEGGEAVFAGDGDVTVIESFADFDAGGVGGFLVQMSKILGLGPIVGVVGSPSKVEEAKALGCDIVIDKSSEDLWEAAEIAGPPNGYGTIMDANGISTLKESYNHLAPSGRLIVFGFHSNLPMGRAILSPIEWIRMAKKAAAMPMFDAMDCTVSNKSILGFNLSFFADEREVLSDMFDQILLWIERGRLFCPNVVQMGMDHVAEAHDLIQSGKSVGKIVLTTSTVS